MSARPTMYILANQGLEMTPGKLAAQVAHAAVEAYKLTPEDDSLKRLWYAGGHYTKIVLGVENAEALRTAQTYIEERGFKTKLIIDEGRTEINPLTSTALGVEIVDKAGLHPQLTFGEFALYKDPPRQLVVETYKRKSKERVTHKVEWNGTPARVVPAPDGGWMPPYDVTEEVKPNPDRKASLWRRCSTAFSNATKGQNPE